MIHKDTVNASSQLFPYYYINFRITGGTPGENLKGQYVIKYSTGETSKAGFADGGGLVLSIMCSATQSPRGNTVFSLYDQSGKLLASKSAFIK
jgi:hypothetical protein